MRTFQGFTVSKKLGSGATSDVFLGISQNGEKRALKIFNQFLPQSHGDVVFRRELENLGQLRNDKIVRVYGLEKNDSGNWVLIQEFIDGVSLRDILAKEIAPLDRVILALIMATEVLYALEESHYKGIVHRDIKPENILLDFSGRIVLSDFGLSKNLNTTITQETFHGNLFGSPQYMSLKQFRNGKVTDDIDLYAVAVLIYEIVSGETPFTGENIEEIITAKKLGQFIPLYKLNAYTPPRLVEIVKVLLNQAEQTPDHRYDKAYKLRFDLLNLLNDFSIDLSASVKMICNGKTVLLSKEHEEKCIGMIIKDLEEDFDQIKDERKRGILLGRILKVDPTNERGLIRKARKWPLVLFLSVFLSAIIIIASMNYSILLKPLIIEPVVPIEDSSTDHILNTLPTLPVAVVNNLERVEEKPTQIKNVAKREKKKLMSKAKTSKTPLKLKSMGI